MTATAYVTPKMLRWARERERLTTEQAAKRLSTTTDRLEGWEAGATRPTFRQAQQIAQRLRVPLGYLFLPEPPTEWLPVPDLRSLPRQDGPELSPDLRDLLLDALEKQQWYRDYQEEEGAEPLPFVGKFTTSDDQQVIAADIARVIGIDAQLRREAHDRDGYVRLLAAQCEDAGVLVMRSGIVENNTRRALKQEEFRGFVISDPLAPLIFVNGNDYKSSQVFTVAHELAHLWIGQSAITDLGYEAPPPARADQIEWFCNGIDTAGKVAGAVRLVPR